MFITILILLVIIFIGYIGTILTIRLKGSDTKLVIYLLLMICPTILMLLIFITYLIIDIFL